MRLIATAVALGVGCTAAADVRFDASNGFGGVGVGRLCRIEIADGLLKVRDIGQDMQLVFDGPPVDASSIDGLSYRYRARGTGPAGGQLYYSWGAASYADSRRWILPPLVADGAWHTVTLSVARDVANPGSWRNGGVVSHLRFDPTDSAGGEIEFEYLSFTGSRTAAPVRAPVRAPNRFDAPIWPTVTPEYYDAAHDPACRPRGPYFGGRFISAADDRDTCDMYDHARRRFFLRRTFSLREAPVVAWLQGIGDESATFSLNGSQVMTATYRHHRAIGSDNAPSVEFVAQHLRKGENALTAEYVSSAQVSGGILAELYVEYADGTCERIDTDREFESSADGRTNWRRVRLLAPPPAPPRVQRLPYRDFSAVQKCLGGGPLAPSVTAGETVRLRYEFEGRAPIGDFDGVVALKKASSVWWRERLELGEGNVTRTGPNRWRLEAAFAAPLYFNDGDFVLEFDSGALHCRSAGIPKAGLAIRRRASIPGLEKPREARVGTLGGAATILVDGRPFPLLWGGVQQWKRPDGLPRHGDMPLTAVTVYNEYGAWHPAVGVYDFASFDSQAELYRRSNPDAYFIWDLTVYPPDEDWLRRHPGEMAADETGDIGSVGRFSWSFASRKSLDEIREMVDRAIRYLEASPYANRIIGYRVNSGVTIEWLGWDARPGHAKDFSEPNKRAFAAFAAERYPDLRDPHVPPPAERAALDGDDLLWDPQRHLNAIAYQDYNSWIVARDILEACGQAKETLRSLGRKKLVGTYYGYTFYLNCSGHDQRRAHFNLREILARNDGRVDYLMSPQSYGQRNLGDVCGEMKPFATLLANGIVPVIEDDTRTHNVPFPFFDDYYQVRTERQTIAMLRRNMSTALCRLSPPYIYALCRGTECDFPAMAEEGRVLRKVQERCLANGTGRHAQIALVASERSIVAMPELTRAVKTGEWRQWYAPDGTVNRAPVEVAALNGEVFLLAHTRFARAGAPVDYLLAEDLKRNPGDYRMYVFLNAFTADGELCAAAEEIRRRGATILWLYAPGWSNGRETSLANMKALTGIDFAKEDEPLVAGVTMKGDGRFMGTPDAKFSPMFHPVRPDVTLGTYENGHPGLAAVKVGKSVSVFSGAWQLDVPFIAGLERKAGVHVYCDAGDPVEANDRLFTLHARSPGVKTVRLPRKATVLDVFARRIVARDADAFAFPAELHSTHLFYFGDDAESLLEDLK